MGTVVFRQIAIRLKRPGRALLIGVVLAFAMLAVLAAALTWPEAPEVTLLKKGKLIVDASHASEGYIEAKCKKAKSRMKLRIIYGDITYTYDLNKEGEYEVFPLQSGSGSYTIALYENSSGKKYTEQGKVKLKAELTDEEAAFLIPNKFVNYTPESETVKLSESMLSGLSSETEKYETVCAYIKDHFMYDFIKAVTVKTGELPAVDETLASKSGICQDLAAVTVCMLRVQGIHARVCIGYADSAYHAWVTANVDGEEKFFDPTVELNGIAKVGTYTQECVY